MQDFKYRQDLPGGRSVLVEGRALRDDYRVTLDLRQRDLGFTRFGYDRIRRKAPLFDGPQVNPPIGPFDG